MANSLSGAGKSTLAIPRKKAFSKGASGRGVRWR